LSTGVTVALIGDARLLFDAPMGVLVTGCILKLVRI
jgi:hypothetical protein